MSKLIVNEIEKYDAGQLTITTGTNVSIGSNLTVGGTIAGTLSTAAQPNITSVGTLSSLAVSGNLTVDTNTLYVDASNNRVGIGTSSPATQLNIAKDSADVEVRLSTTTSGNVRLGMDASGAVYNWIQTDRSSSAMQFAIGNAERMRIDSSGRVGIGTSSPNSPLTVVGGAIRSKDTDADSGFDFYQTTLGGLVRLRDNKPMYFYTNNAVAMTINASGQVGIGTTSFSTFDKVRITGTNTVANDLVLATPNTAQSRIFFSDTDAEGVGELGYDHASNAMRIVTNGSERLRIDSSGRVGINSNPDGTGILAIKQTTDVTNGGLVILATDGTGAVISRLTDGGLTFRNGGSERMRIDSSGNVGIGTSSVNAPLHVLGKNVTNGTAEFTPNAAKGSNASYVHYGTNGDWYIRSASASGNVNIQDTGGNVGIGTSSPSTTLDVQASASYGRFKSTTGTNSTFVNFENAAGNFWVGRENSTGASFGASNYAAILYSENAYPMEFFTNSQKRMVIDSSGNVGIGTSSPNASYKLTVAGGIPADIYSSSTANSATYGSVRIGRQRATAGQGNGLGFAMYDTASNMVEYSYIGTEIIDDTAGSQDGAIVFYPIVNAARTLKARIDNDGLKFNGDTAAANGLDDYEEGDWTPAISFGNASVGVTYGTNSLGHYTKIGRQVTVTGLLQLTNKGSSTGAARITGLPFTIGNNVRNYGGVALANVYNVSFADMITGYGALANTEIVLTETTNAGVLTLITDANFSNNSEIIVGFTYFI